MLCQDCKKREAQVHFTQIINNEKQSLSLCRECADARGFHSPLDNMPFPLAEILSGLAANIPNLEKETEEDPITCPECGLSFTMFTRQGRFGCEQCYKEFRNRLELIMRKIHGASMHRGKVPVGQDKKETEVTISVKEEERLKSEMEKALNAEDYERAAEIRDKLKTLRKTLEAKGKV